MAGRTCQMKIWQARVARLADHGAGIGLGADQQRLSDIPLMARTCGGKQFVPGPFGSFLIEYINRQVHR